MNSGFGRRATGPGVVIGLPSGLGTAADAEPGGETASALPSSTAPDGAGAERAVGPDTPRPEGEALCGNSGNTGETFALRWGN